jgi:hypothetical protein
LSGRVSSEHFEGGRHFFGRRYLVVSTTEAVNPKLEALVAAGTSPWLDYLRRSLISTGELKDLTVTRALRGVTSNPSILEKAILESDDYDDELAQLFKGELDTKSIHEQLSIGDVQNACDAMRRPGTRAAGRTGSSPWRLLPTSLMTDQARRKPPAISGRGSIDPTWSRSPAPSRGLPRSNSASMTASTSTSRCCSESRCTSGSPTPTCPVSSAGDRTAAPSTSRLWRASSCPESIRRS